MAKRRDCQKARLPDSDQTTARANGWREPSAVRSPLLETQFGSRAVWQSRRLAVALSGSRALWQSRSLAVALSGSRALWQSRSLAVALSGSRSLTGSGFTGDGITLTRQ